MGYYRLAPAGWSFFVGVPCFTISIISFSLVPGIATRYPVGPGYLWAGAAGFTGAIFVLATSAILNGDYVSNAPSTTEQFLELFRCQGLRGFRCFRGTVVSYREGNEDFSFKSFGKARYISTSLIFLAVIGVMFAFIGLFYATFVFFLAPTANNLFGYGPGSSYFQFSLRYALMFAGFLFLGLWLPAHLGHSTSQLWRRDSGRILLPLAWTVSVVMVVYSSIIGFNSFQEAQSMGRNVASNPWRTLFFALFPLGMVLFGTLCIYTWLPLGDLVYKKYGTKRKSFFPPLLEDLDPGKRLEHVLSGEDLLAKLRVQSSDFTTGTLIGRGGFGVVYRGKLRGDVSIAIKIINGVDQDTALEGAWKMFERELRIWAGLSQQNGALHIPDTIALASFLLIVGFLYR